MIGEVATFKRNAMRDAERLGDPGTAEAGEKISSEIWFLTQDVATMMADCNGEWLFRLRAALKTIGINTGQLEMLPWERLLLSLAGSPMWPRPYGCRRSSWSRSATAGPRRSTSWRVGGGA